MTLIKRDDRIFQGIDYYTKPVGSMDFYCVVLRVICRTIIVMVILLDILTTSVLWFIGCVTIVLLVVRL